MRVFWRRYRGSLASHSRRYRKEATMHNAEFTIYDLIARNAARYDRREAVTSGDDTMSFGEFHRRGDAFAAGLLGEGLAAGERIALLAGNGPDFLPLCAAAARIGAIVVPVNWRLGPEEIAYILADTTPRFLFCDRGFRDLAGRSAAGASSLEKRFVLADDGEETTAPALETGRDDFLPWPPGGRAAEGFAAPNGSLPPPSGRGVDPLLIIHTAAVGGRPRGCILSQDNLMATAAQLAHLLRLDDRDAHVGLLPLFHIGGLAMTLTTMLVGGRNILVPKFDPPAVLRVLAGNDSAFFGTFPPMLGALLDAEEKGEGAMAGLRLVCGVDAPATIERFLRRHPQAEFFSLYGQTEVMPVSGGSYRDCPGGIGRPSLLTRVVLRDDRDEEAPPGTTGEICVRSPAVFQGYWRLPEETAAAARNGWHHTGDLGRLDEDGFLWHMGRKPEKELIKTGGENVYPGEVEKAILAHGAIVEACVFGVPDPEWGEAVQAVCVIAAGARVSAEELRDFVATRIARYKLPKQVIFVTALPKTPAGSIDREAVKAAWGRKG
ncbi:MAG: AMP-binding protein [Pseudomonadota bacterium]|nr:AMP-binding protein [Pseudomonadota bacterium]